MTIASPTSPSIPGAAQVTVAGESIALLPHRAAYWPATRSLLIADLHLDKCEIMRSVGLPIPRDLLEEQIARLDAAIQATSAQRVLVVGDLLHAPAGLTGPMVERFAAWRAASPVEVAIVPGNHDRALARIADAWRLTILSSVHVEGPFTFVHDPAHRPHSPNYAWVGHIHPTITLRTAADSMKLPCFHVTSRMGILPAFSSFTAGAQVKVSRADRVFAIAGDSVMQI